MGRTRRVDLICGGFPCQDLSVAGRRAGLAGERSSLFFEFARIADLVLPPGGWILIENVPGLLSSNGGRDYAVVLATLAELGFHDLAWRVLDSRHFGVAQRRRRVYILARRARGDRACQVLLEPEGSAGHPQTRREAGPDAAVASLSGLGSGGPDDNDGQAGRIVTAGTVTAMYGNGTGHAADEITYLPLSAGVRRLTPRECERLQGFPDDWTLIPGASDSKRYAALGDAVTVPIAEWIGRRLMAVAA
jgi:DNA (cytosine-5)-methyltransferase 1